MQFDSMVDGVGIAKYHCYFYQLLVLWGTSGSADLSPCVCDQSLLREKLQQGGAQKPVPSDGGHRRTADLFALITGLMCRGTGADPGTGICKGYL